MILQNVRARTAKNPHFNVKRDEKILQITGIHCNTHIKRIDESLHAIS